MKLMRGMTTATFRAWWGPNRSEGKNINYSDLGRKVERFESRINFLYRAVFGGPPGDRVTYRPPYLASCYRPETDQLIYSLSLIVMPAQVQDVGILHEFRHRLVTTGKAALFRDFSSLRTYVSEEREARLLQQIKRDYPPDRWVEELDASIVSSAARQLLDMTGDARLMKAMLFRSPQ